MLLPAETPGAAGHRTGSLLLLRASGLLSSLELQSMLFPLCLLGGENVHIQEKYRIAGKFSFLESTLKTRGNLCNGRMEKSR